MFRMQADPDRNIARALDKEFYESYDPDFLRTKCLVLHAVIRSFEDVQEFFAARGLGLDLEDKRRLSANIYFTEFQMFEALLALLFAAFQSEPHWIYVSRYSTKLLRQAVEKYLVGDVKGATSSNLDTKADFVRIALYNGLEPLEGKDRWDASVENVVWLLDRMMQKYRNALEYNAFKHGVRVFAHPTEFGITSNEDPTLTVKWESEDSVRFLELTGVDDKTMVSESVRQFDIDESIDHAELIYQMLRTIKSTRLAKPTNGERAEVLFLPDLDRSSLSKRWLKDFKFSLNIGVYTKANEKEGQGGRKKRA